jgi:hypothetical protein
MVKPTVEKLVNGNARRAGRERPSRREGNNDAVQLIMRDQQIGVDPKGAARPPLSKASRRRSRANDCDRPAGLNLRVENASFEAGRQNVAHHHERFFIGAGGNGTEARLRVGNAKGLGQGPVDPVAENPSAVRCNEDTWFSGAIDAFAARGGAGDQQPSPDLSFVTAAATSSTTPTRSWPRIRPSSRWRNRPWECIRSVPHIVVWLS